MVKMEFHHITRNKIYFSCNSKITRKNLKMESEEFKMNSFKTFLWSPQKKH